MCILYMYVMITHCLYLICVLRTIEITGIRRPKSLYINTLKPNFYTLPWIIDNFRPQRRFDGLDDWVFTSPVFKSTTDDSTEKTITTTSSQTTETITTFQTIATTEVTLQTVSVNMSILEAMFALPTFNTKLLENLTFFNSEQHTMQYNLTTDAMELPKFYELYDDKIPEFNKSHYTAKKTEYSEKNISESETILAETTAMSIITFNIPTVEEQVNKFKEGSYDRILLEFLRIITQKSDEDAQTLVSSIETQLSSLQQFGSLLSLGLDTIKIINENVRMFSLFPGDIIKASAALVYQLLKNRKVKLSNEINALIEIMNVIRNNNDEKRSEILLGELDAYPDIEKDANQLIKDILIEGVVGPYEQIADTDEGTIVKNLLVTIISKYNQNKSILGEDFNSLAGTSKYTPNFRIYKKYFKYADLYKANKPSHKKRKVTTKERKFFNIASSKKVFNRLRTSFAAKSKLKLKKGTNTSKEYKISSSSNEEYILKRNIRFALLNFTKTNKFKRNNKRSIIVK